MKRGHAMRDAQEGLTMHVEAALLRGSEQQVTAEWIASHQQSSGEILWRATARATPGITCTPPWRSACKSNPSAPRLRIAF
jgi:hypothetical protein